MIKKLRRKFVFIVMAVVTVILLAIFFTMLISMYRNNERTSMFMLRQALSIRSVHAVAFQQAGDDGPTLFFRESGGAGMRMPVLVLHVDKNGRTLVITNQLHFITNEQAHEIAKFFEKDDPETGRLKNFGLRYLKRNDNDGMRIALADTSIEQEILTAQVNNSLLIGAAAMLIFFLLSLVLAHWAVRPMELAWEKQKQFVANASHELKTPLTVILSNADILREDNMCKSEKNARRIEHIHTEAVRMKLLVEDMLVLAKSDVREKPAAYSIVDLSYIVKSAALMYEPIAFDSNKEILYKIADNICVMGDSQKLQQVMHILLDNAVKYSYTGGRICINLNKAERNSLLLTVENEGSPIPVEELEQIFLRFYRCDEARSEHGSFGLGLSIAQSIVGEHRGKIWAESDGQSKNCFSMALPVVSL